MGWTQFVIPIVTGGAAIVTAIRDVKKDKKIKWYTWFLIVAALITLGFDIFNKKSDSDDADQRHQDIKNIVTQTGDSIKGHTDSSTNQLKSQNTDNTRKILDQETIIKRKIDSLGMKSLNLDIKPTFDVSVYFLYLPTSDTVDYNIVLRQKRGKFHNFKIHYGFIYIDRKRGLQDFNFLNEAKSGPQALAEPGDTISIYNRSILKPYDTLFCYVRIYFQDEENHDGIPVHKIFRFIKGQRGRIFSDAKSEEYMRMKAYLASQEAW